MNNMYTLWPVDAFRGNLIASNELKIRCLFKCSPCTPGYLKGFDFVEEHMRAALFCRRCSLSECVEPRPPPTCEFKGDVYVHEPYS